MSRANSVVMTFIAIVVLVCSAALIAADKEPVEGMQTNVITSVPRSMTYQGVLKDADGEPVPDSFFDVSFRIFDAETEGNELWSQLINIGTDANGMFTAELSDLDIPFDDDYWLELEIASEILTPRQKLTMVGYSARADTADYALASEGSVASWSVTDSVLYTNGYWGIARGNADNALLGNQAFTMVNLGVACTTGVDTENSQYSTVSGGYGNRANQNYSTIGGGLNNFVSMYSGTIGGGSNNRTVHEYATIGGGLNNWAHWQYTTVGGGQDNMANDWYSVVAGGLADTAYGQYNTIAGGRSNYTSSSYTAIGGGRGNKVTDLSSVIAGGQNNLISEFYAAICGGIGNQAGRYSIVGGGEFNTADGEASVIAGGYRNSVQGSYSAIPGGYVDTITATGDFSFLFGIGSKLTQDSTFMVDMPHIRFGDEVSGYEFPVGDGSVGQVMSTDGAGQLNWVDMSGGANGWVDDGTVVRLETDTDNVGIGISSPGSKLDVNGNIRGRNNFILDGSASISGDIDVYGTTTELFRLNQASNDGFVLTSDASGNGTWQPLNSIQGSGDINHLAKFTAGNMIGSSLIYDNGTNIGIGTTSPAGRLDVNGNIRGQGDLDLDGNAAISGYAYAYGVDAQIFHMNPGAAPGNVLTSDASGYGTWQPLNAIQGIGSLNYIPKFIDQIFQGNSQIYDDGSNVGIGTNSPSSKLDVNGNISASGNLIVTGNVTAAGAVAAYGNISSSADLQVMGNASVAGDVIAWSADISSFRLNTGASSGYVLTSDGVGNGTWQPLPGFANGQSPAQQSARIDEMTNLIEKQNEKIAQLEKRIAELEQSR